MFITLRCNRNEVSIADASVSTSRGTRPRHAACNNCRSKKLKCSGSKPSCTGCLDGKIVCTYSSARSSSRSRRSSRQRKEISRRSSGSVDLTIPYPLIPRESLEEDSFKYQYGLEEVPSSERHLSCSMDEFWRDLTQEDLDNALNEAVDVATRSSRANSSSDLGSGTAQILDSLSEPFENSLQDIDWSSISWPELASSEDVYLEDSSPANTSAFETMIRSPDALPEWQPSSGSGCSCRPDALAALDQLQREKSTVFSSTTACVSALLLSNKVVTTCCNSILQSSCCSFKPDCALLLASICKNLVSQFQRLLACLDGVYDTPAVQTVHDSDTGCGDGAEESPGRIGAYCIDNTEEQSQVQIALASVRGKSLAMLLSRMKTFSMLGNAADHGKDYHALLDSHKKSLDILKSMSSENFVVE